MNVPLSMRAEVKRLTLSSIVIAPSIRISLQSCANEGRLVHAMPRVRDAVRGAHLLQPRCVQTSRLMRSRTWLPVTWHDRSRRTGSRTAAAAGINAPRRRYIWAWLGTTSDGVMLQRLHQQWWWAHHWRQHHPTSSSAPRINCAFRYSTSSYHTVSIVLRNTYTNSLPIHSILWFSLVPAYLVRLKIKKKQMHNCISNDLI